MRFLIAVIDSNTNSADGDEMAAIDAFNDQLQANGQFIMACGIYSPEEAVVIDNRRGAEIKTDGPLHNTVEYMSGFWLIKASTEEEAQQLAMQGSKACNRKVELRKLHG